jgi:hypothetical protein
MSEIVERLLAEAQKLEELVKQRDSKNVAEPLRRLRDAANQVGQSWSGSWLGYQSRVYYADLQPTPAGAHFSTEWGFQDLSLGIDVGGTRGEWCEYTFDSVRQAIFSLAGVDSLGSAERLAVRSKEAFDYCQEEFMSLAFTTRATHSFRV